MNKIPPVKKFVKESGGVDQYDCNVKFIPGHNPDLVLSVDGVETSRIDLTQYKSQEDLHGLFQSAGIARKNAIPVQTEL